MSEGRLDLAVVGGGPGGYTAAIRAAQLGMRVAVIEREGLGGVCGNWGCIPSKALIAAAEIYDRARRGAEMGIVADGISVDYARVLAHSRAAADRVSRGVAGLLRKHRIEVVQGEARLDGTGKLTVEGEALPCARILLATGSAERMLPGVEVDSPTIVTSREILELPTLPSSMVIVGGGAIGLEFAYVLRCFEVEVTVVELERTLLPGADASVTREIERVFSRRGVKVRTKCAVQEVRREGGGVAVDVAREGKVETISAERCLIAVGRRPRSDEMGIPEAGIALERGFVQVGDAFQTSVPHVFAIGDLIDSPALAHVASAEGIAAVEMMAGERPPGRLDRRRIPVCVYGHPEIATIGLTEEQARAAGYDVQIGMVPLRALGRAIASGDDEGLIKIVSESRFGEILGCHIVAPNATDLIAEAVAAMALEGTTSDLGRAVHAHPTFAEALMEGSLATIGEAINL